MNRALQHINKNDNWVTPWPVVDFLGRFALDVAAESEHVAKAPRFFTPEIDGLKQPWDFFWWCNPPFSRAAEFITKAKNEFCPGMMILPANVGTKWFSELLADCAEYGWAVKFWPNRIQFLDPKTGKPYRNKEGKLSGNTGGSIIVAFYCAPFVTYGKGFVYLEAQEIRMEETP